jgi:hypothetical protein
MGAFVILYTTSVCGANDRTNVFGHATIVSRLLTKKDLDTVSQIAANELAEQTLNIIRDET